MVHMLFFLIKLEIFHRFITIYRNRLVFDICMLTTSNVYSYTVNHRPRITFTTASFFF